MLNDYAVKEALVRSGAYIEGSLVNQTMGVYSGGYMTHRIKRAVNGVDLSVEDMKTGYETLVDARAIGILLAGLGF